RVDGAEVAAIGDHDRRRAEADTAQFDRQAEFADRDVRRQRTGARGEAEVHVGDSGWGPPISARAAAPPRRQCDKDCLRMRQDRLSLEDLALVRGIGDAGSLAGAVRALEVDHSAAFRRLAAMEARLGTVLFRRSRRGYTPTDAGEVAIVAARRILADAQAPQRQLPGGDARSEERRVG